MFVNFRSPNIYFIIFLIVLSFLSIRFVSNDLLATFGDDSASCFIMAQFFSPYHSLTEVTANAYHNSYFPPFFPVILAVLGAAHNIVYAHILVAVFFLLSCIMVYILASKYLNNKWSGFYCAVLFSLLPYTWLYMLPVMSESLYLFLTLCILFYYEKQIKESSPDLTSLTIFGLLLSICVLTRTIGLSMLLAYAFVVLVRYKKEMRKLLYFSLPVIIVLIIYGFWHLVKSGSDSSASYSSNFGIFIPLFQQQPDLIWALFIQNISDVFLSWNKAFLLFWHFELNISSILVTLFGLVVILGWMLRLKAFKLDAWYVLISLIIIIIWPYTGHVKRFMYPLFPLLIFYGFYFLSYKSSNLKNKKLIVPKIVFLLLGVVTIPGLTFIYQRTQMEDVNKLINYQQIFDFYRQENLEHARDYSILQASIMEHMNKIREKTDDSSTILWIKPSFMSLLAKRHSLPLPRGSSDISFLHDVRKTNADYAFITNLTNFNNTDGLDALFFYKPFSTPVWAEPIGSNAASILLRINKEELSNKIKKLEKNSDKEVKISVKNNDRNYQNLIEVIKKLE